MFPSELTLYPNWVCWKYERENGKDKLTKRPYNPKTGKLASPTDENTWADYQIAVSVASNGGGYNGIGFVLSEKDPFLIVDLDDPKGNPAIIQKQIQLVKSFDTYSEISPSGNGLHLIAKGKVFGGRKRNGIEIYSSERYFTMTGNTYEDKPIAERNHLASQLWEELGDNGGGNNIELKVVSQPEKYTDEIIYNVASQANNGTKFLDLWNGYWQKYYSSQSEADFAIINMFGFYSRNIAQIRRLFLQSALGKRDKANRKVYVDTMIKRSFDNLPPLLDLETVILAAAQILIDKRKEQAAIEVNPNSNPWNGSLFSAIPDPDYDWTRPPGLLGEISQFIYDAAPRPVKEIALGAAIGLMAGICGSAYNVSRTGLNAYILMLAKTGIGKEAAYQGIEKLLHAVRPQVPAITEFIGPSDIASGQALIKHISKKPCFVSMVGEFGLMLENMHSQSANPSQVALKRKLLELYNKSGAQDVLRETIYSDKSNNTEIVKSPAFSLLGESTPEVFYRSIDENMISQGLLPRFTCIEYTGNRPEANDNAQFAIPTEDLLSKLATLAAGCLMLGQHKKAIDIEFNHESEQFHKQYRTKCDANINASDQIVTRELWNRAHLKVLKLAGLIAIGQNIPQNKPAPIITVEGLTWAIQLVERDILNILSKFETGKAGKEAGELNQINEVINVISYYIRKDFVNVKNYRVDERMHKDGIIPLSYIQKRLVGVKAFTTDRIGATNGIARAVRALQDEDCIREVRPTDMLTRYSSQAKAYFVCDPTRF